jgi:hypothetical protein
MGTTLSFAPRFLSIDVKVSLSGYRKLIADAVRQSIWQPGGFWLESLHVFNATVEMNENSVACTYAVADIPEADGKYLSSTLSDDHLKAAITDVVARGVLGVSAELFPQEYWRRYIHVSNIDRAAQNFELQTRYLEWMRNLKSPL